MAKKKDEWKAWREYAEKLHTEKSRMDFLKWLRSTYPVLVQKAIVMALSVAEIMLQESGSGSSSGDFVMVCSFYEEDCARCMAKTGIDDCSFPTSDDMGVKAAKRVYARSYRQLPIRWRKLL